MASEVPIDVRELRARFQLTQVEFAARFGLTSGAVRSWESARRQPCPVSRTLLRVIATSPKVVMEAVRG